MKTFRWTIVLFAIPLLAIGCREPTSPAGTEEDRYQDETYQEQERPVQPEQEAWGEEEQQTEVTEQQKEQRQAYIDRIDNEIERLEDQIDQIEDRLGDMPEQVRTDVQPRIDGLRGHIDATRTRYEGWDEMTQEAFEETQTNVDERLEEARNTYQEISERVDQGMVAPAAG